MNMLVHQCSSCQKISKAGLARSSSDQPMLPALPSFWTRITVDRAWGNTAERNKVTYDLCNECSRKPITFGDISLTRGEE